MVSLAGLASEAMEMVSLCIEMVSLAGLASEAMEMVSLAGLASKAMEMVSLAMDCRPAALGCLDVCGWASMELLACVLLTDSEQNLTSDY
jgi:hypothetical protein